VAVHNSDVNGHTVKCSWGKESGDPNNISTNSQLALPQLVQSAQFPFNFATGAAAPHMTGFYYPQPITTAAAAAAAAAQAAAQSNYLQGLQGYTFNNFGASYPQGYLRSGALPGMQLASYGVPNQSAAAALSAATSAGQLPHGTSQLASHHGAALGQAGVVPTGYGTPGGATMQQFQANNLILPSPPLVN